MGITVRPARSDDAEALADAWREGARELIDMAPERFRVPDYDGLVEFIRRDLEDGSRADFLSIVADFDSEVAGSLEARMLAAVKSARFQVLRSLGQPRVYVDHLRVAPQFRRRGVGTELLVAAERWGRERGAMSIALDTSAQSPLSVPFYEALGFQRTSIVFEKLFG
jgi:ribosomal protein S18 acetylase RimI-like enzyme